MIQSLEQSEAVLRFSKTAILSPSAAIRRADGKIKTPAIHFIAAQACGSFVQQVSCNKVSAVRLAVLRVEHTAVADNAFCCTGLSGIS